MAVTTHSVLNDRVTNRAIAHSMAFGPETGLRLVDEIADLADLILSRLERWRYNPNQSFPGLASRGLQRKVTRWVTSQVQSCHDGLRPPIVETGVGYDLAEPDVTKCVVESCLGAFGSVAVSPGRSNEPPAHLEMRPQRMIF
jgi:hypothetical protein